MAAIGRLAIGSLGLLLAAVIANAAPLATVIANDASCEKYRNDLLDFIGSFLLADWGPMQIIEHVTDQSEFVQAYKYVGGYCGWDNGQFAGDPSAKFLRNNGKEMEKKIDKKWQGVKKTGCQMDVDRLAEYLNQWPQPNSPSEISQLVRQTKFAQCWPNIQEYCRNNPNDRCAAFLQEKKEIQKAIKMNYIKFGETVMKRKRSP